MNYFADQRYADTYCSEEDLANRIGTTTKQIKTMINQNKIPEGDVIIHSNNSTNHCYSSDTADKIITNCSSAINLKTTSSATKNKKTSSKNDFIKSIMDVCSERINNKVETKVKEFADELYTLLSLENKVNNSVNMYARNKSEITRVILTAFKTKLWNSVISGTCQEILDELYAAHKAGTISLSGDFPATAAELGFELKKWENQLRANGLQITRSRTATARICTIRNCN